MPMYNRGKRMQRDWTGGTWRVLLVTSSYTPNVDHDFVADVVANEASGTGYVRKDVTGRALTVDDTNDRVDHDASNLTWTTMTSAFRYAVLYWAVTNDSDHELHSYYDLGAQSITAQDFTIKWNGGASSGAVFRGT